MMRLKAFVSMVLAALLGACSGTLPQGLGLNDGRLAPCPSSPNCVCSCAESGGHAVAPLDPWGGHAPQDPDAQQAMRRVEEAVASLPGATVVERVPGYLRAECASRVFGFVDDLECAYDPDTGLVHVRSAARLGYSDFGVNRKRVEQLRDRLASLAEGGTVREGEQ